MLLLLKMIGSQSECACSYPEIVCIIIADSLLSGSQSAGLLISADHLTTADSLLVGIQSEHVLADIQGLFLN